MEGGVVDCGSVDVTEKANRFGVFSLCYRLAGVRRSGAMELVKKPRWSTEK